MIFKIPRNLVFSYSIGNLGFPGIYTRVVCPIGSGRILVGIVVGIVSNPDPSLHYKDIIQFLDAEPILGKQEYLLSQYICKRYLCSWGESLSLFFPFVKSKVHLEVCSNKINVEKVLYSLSLEQQQALKIIQKESVSSKFLLHGITGSGKTHVYLKLIEECLNEGKQAIVLLPEIALTPQVVSLFSRFWKIICITSKVSTKKRLQAIKQFFYGEVFVLVGTRSAICTPSKNLGLIIIDEEHDESFKNGSSPRYNAVSIAFQRAKLCGAKLILGSATPNVEHYYYAKKSEGIQLVSLSKRFGGGSLPVSEIVKSKKKKNDLEFIDERILYKLQEVLANKKQSIVYLNRRAYHGGVRCKFCRFIFSCNRCGIPFKYHKDIGIFSCHYCCNKKTYEKTCFQCGRASMEGISTGIQKVVEELEKKITSARILRADSDILNTSNKIERSLLDFQKGLYDILVGTQIISKGHDFAKVSRVVILHPEMELSLGDFRCSERVYSHITQVSGRAGRREEVGEVFIQTNMENVHYAIERGRQQDYQGFYEEEIIRRKIFGYPPYMKLLKIVFRSSNQVLCKKESTRTYEFLQKIIREKEDVCITEPSPCMIEKINNKHRWWLLIKAVQRKNLIFLGEKVQEFYQKKSGGKRSSFHVEYDMDPIDFI